MSRDQQTRAEADRDTQNFGICGRTTNLS